MFYKYCQIRVFHVIAEALVNIYVCNGYWWLANSYKYKHLHCVYRCVNIAKSLCLNYIWRRFHGYANSNILFVFANVCMYILLIICVRLCGGYFWCFDFAIGGSRCLAYCIFNLLFRSMLRHLKWCMYNVSNKICETVNIRNSRVTIILAKYIQTYSVKSVIIVYAIRVENLTLWYFSTK